MRLKTIKETIYKKALPAFWTFETFEEMREFLDNLEFYDFTEVGYSENLTDVVEDLQDYGFTHADVIRASFARYGQAFEVFKYNGVYFGYFGQY